MNAYLLPIQTAILVFPILAFLLTIPYILHQYRTYGATLPSRILLVFSFIFYLLCCYFLVSLPLPPIEEVRAYTTPTMQLVPFASLKEISMTTSLIWDDPSTYLTALNEPSMLQVLFNILMCIPFGVYLRYYFQFSLKKTIGFSFLLSLSFELLQLSGLLFLYPRPYRLFDVDDLITNTLGGLIGYGITPLLVHFFPSREQLDERSYRKGQQVSALRRVFAFLIDGILLFVSYIGYLIVTPTSTYDGLFYVSLITIYFFVIPFLTHGKTIGKLSVKLTLVPIAKDRIVWYQYLLHFLPLYGFVIPSPYIFLLIFLQFTTTKAPAVYGWYALFAGCMACYLFYILSAVSSLFHKQVHRYERFSNLKNASTIPVPTHPTTDPACDVPKEEASTIKMDDASDE